LIVFEDKEHGDKAVAAVEKQIHYGDGDVDQDHGVPEIEERPSQKHIA
jgi:hypothetical protein